MVRSSPCVCCCTSRTKGFLPSTCTSSISTSRTQRVHCDALHRDWCGVRRQLRHADVPVTDSANQRGVWWSAIESIGCGRKIPPSFCWILSCNGLWVGSRATNAKPDGRLAVIAAHCACYVGSSNGKWREDDAGIGLDCSVFYIKICVSFLTSSSPLLLLIYLDRKSTRLNSSHSGESRMPSSA